MIILHTWIHYYIALSNLKFELLAQLDLLLLFAF